MANTDKKTRIIAIADYLFANPDKERSDVLAMFGKSWQISNRTVDRLIKESKDYNEQRLKKQEVARDEAIDVIAKSDIMKGVVSRIEAIRILSDIANGETRIIENEKIIPTDGDRIRAIQQLSKMEGWDAPAKSEVTGKDGSPLIPPISRETARRIIENL